MLTLQKIKDRVVLTDQFSRPGEPVAGSPAAQLNALFDSANCMQHFLQMQ
jgi:iron complex outermembrane receptor protein